MQVYKGSHVLSPFREQKLLTQLKAVEPQVSAVTAQYLHFVDVSRKLAAQRDEQLRELLTYGSDFRGKISGQLFLVIPRLGTVSPWSSKATDIARNSGLTAIKRIERGVAYYVSAKSKVSLQRLTPLLHDRMTETVLTSLADAEQIFQVAKPRPLVVIDILKSGKSALVEANTNLGLALAADEIDYLYDAYSQLGRNPTDAEIMMFSLVNSEHCRHKIFNASWIINGKKQPKSLFKMITNTYDKGGQNVLSAYSDNAAVLKGPPADWFLSDPKNNVYHYYSEPVHLVTKVETHNHPTAIAPFPGAATGNGGEIRDEAATGRGSKAKIGLTGYSVSNLNLKGAKRPWEKTYGKPNRIASALDIMIDAPLGGAAYNNEFGRPNLAGYFRTYEAADIKHLGETWGYHKPIMVAGGLGNIRAAYVKKAQVPVGAKIIVLGGPAMLIGLGGGAASSMQTGDSEENLDFASVQRANAEMQRRAQEVINACWARTAKNPIISIHDVGAGGISNALPELVHDAGLGARFELRSVPNAEPGMSPMEIWCNEAQERYVLAISSRDLALFKRICERERCPYAVVGQTTKKAQLIVSDSHFKNRPVDIPMDVLFGKPPKMVRDITRIKNNLPNLNTRGINIAEAVKRVLQLPAVGSKKFLITIGDRNVGGLTVRDQMVGPWQVPVSDVAVSASSFHGQTGEALAMGERTPLARIDGPSSARIAIGEALTNILAADIKNLSDIKLSANWMAATGFRSEDEKLFDTVKAVGEVFCPALGITIPVGKDSLSMRTVWEERGKQKSVASPLSLLISAFAPVMRVRRTLTPQLQTDQASTLILIDLGKGKNRLGGSALAQVYNQLGNQTPDVEPLTLRKFFAALQDLKQKNRLLAYHDRSDGGLLATLAEMAFTSRCGLTIDLTDVPGTALESLFTEELGVVVQVKSDEAAAIMKQLRRFMGSSVYDIGSPTVNQDIVIRRRGKPVYYSNRAQLESWWADTSYQVQKLRDNPSCANEEFKAIKQARDPGLSASFDFSLTPKTYRSRPKVAIFREQGVNGHVEMAAAFDKAGFTAVDVHLQDIVTGRVSLDNFAGLVACGGFSYGDVLGAGEGWAKSILFNKALRDQFQRFFNRSSSFSLGVCNGCQMLSALKSLIPGAELWPQFLKNKSEQFEARLVRLKIQPSPSIFFKDMTGALLPIPVAHGEGQAEFTISSLKKAERVGLIAARYVDNDGLPTESYPANPNGSPGGITALTTPDGRATIMMPHPERAFLTKQLSWAPTDWAEDTPWLKMFQNAREWVDTNR